MTDELNTTPPPPPPDNGKGVEGVDKASTDAGAGHGTGEAAASESSQSGDGPPDMPGPPPPSGAGGAPPPPPSATTGGGGGSDSSGNRTLMLVLSYLGPLAFVPFFAAQDDPEVHWHAKNGLVLFAAEVALWFVLFVISMTGFLSCLTCFASFGLTLGLFVVHVWCIYSALNGKRPIIPGLSQLADSF